MAADSHHLRRTRASANVVGGGVCSAIPVDRFVAGCRDNSIDQHGRFVLG
jgi:hypothetical protein